MQSLPVKYIQPDENQPRKYFNAQKMRSLKESINKEGIINPLIVERINDKAYLLIDGERRYRAAVELNLKEVPVVIEEPRDEKDRLIRQFAIQEQHEAWTPLEKAMALNNLARTLDVSIFDVCKILGLSQGDARRYVAFSELADKEAYLKSEVPLDWAVAIRSARRHAKNITETILENSFPLSDEKRFERHVLKNIRNGELTSRKDFVRLKDAFTKNPKLIAKYLANENETPTSMFSEAKAAGAYHLRNLAYSVKFLTNHGRRFLEVKDVEIPDDVLRRMKEAREVLIEIIKLVD